ncbi:MAG: hypothetical protein HOE53_00045, partial [Candidatus Magasanikbacteria bacterium]|nr:hypothetical protein [Candidatus Magasanikbacteria bacterium]
MIEFGIFTLNIEAVAAFFSQPILSIVYELFVIGGYLFLVYAALHIGIMYYVEYRSAKMNKDWKWIVLAVDVPPMNLQTPKAVEQMFSHLAGAYNKPDIAEKFRGGFEQRWFSFEIISIEGYIQFIIRTEESFRDLVAAAMYAQYPDAEITEVEDYVTTVPKTYPNKEYDMWGGDFGLVNDDAYPIRTYEEFEHKISKDTELKDPMSAFLESFSRIGPGEQMWFQMLVRPTGGAWKEKAIAKIKELIGEKVEKKGNKFADMVTNGSMKMLEGIGDQVFNREAGIPGAAGSEDNGPPNKLSSFTPGQRRVVESMEDKISKVGFKCKIRAVYVARKEVFRPNRGVNALIGAINQFNVPTANAIVPKAGVGASYFFAEKRTGTKKTQ